MCSFILGYVSHDRMDYGVKKILKKYTKHCIIFCVFELIWVKELFCIGR